MGSKANEYRRRAHQCLEMARTFGDREARSALCYMAEAWLRLAEMQDASIAAPSAVPRQPFIQQQQQIQPKGDDKKD